jgi:hypothetical protein
MSRRQLAAWTEQHQNGATAGSLRSGLTLAKRALPNLAPDEPGGD